jgi:hypothetical protein
VKTIGYDVFLDILSKRLGGRYSVKQLKAVIDTYTASDIGILGQMKEREEFKDKYFGMFRFTEKGFLNYCKEMQAILSYRLNTVRLSHDMQDRKKKMEKKRKNRWRMQNAIEGYKYKDKEKIAMGRKIAAIKTRQVKFMNRKLRDQLQVERKIRKIRSL